MAWIGKRTCICLHQINLIKQVRPVMGCPVVHYIHAIIRLHKRPSVASYMGCIGSCKLLLYVGHLSTHVCNSNIKHNWPFPRLFHLAHEPRLINLLFRRCRILQSNYLDRYKATSPIHIYIYISASLFPY